MTIILFTSPFLYPEPQPKPIQSGSIQFRSIFQYGILISLGIYHLQPLSIHIRFHKIIDVFVKWRLIRESRVQCVLFTCMCLCTIRSKRRIRINPTIFVINLCFECFASATASTKWFAFYRKLLPAIKFIEVFIINFWLLLLCHFRFCIFGIVFEIFSPKKREDNLFVYSMWQTACDLIACSLYCCMAV